MLPEGAIQMPESSEKPIQGRIEKPLAGSSNSSWTNRVGSCSPCCSTSLFTRAQQSSLKPATCVLHIGVPEILIRVMGRQGFKVGEKSIVKPAAAFQLSKWPPAEP